MNVSINDGIKRSVGGVDVRDDFDPIWVGEFDIAQPPAELSVFDSKLEDQHVSPSKYKAARLLLRFQQEPIGVVIVPVDADGLVDIDAVVKDAENRFCERVDEIRAQSSKDRAVDESGMVISAELYELASSHLPGISVVIGTMRRPEEAVTCVRFVLGQKYAGPLEVIVVDNGIIDDKTRRAIERHYGEDDRVRYVAEVPRGLSRARNIGLARATYPITAFLSDDIRVDPLWALGIARGFQRTENIKGVSGRVVPRFLDNVNQIESERALGWATSQGFDPQTYDFVDPKHPLRPYAGCYFNGSNIAFDTEFFLTAGGFAEDLGPGTIARGGEDIEAPVRILALGGQMAYDPVAVGWLYDQFEGRPFARQAYSYGIGLTAYLMSHMIDPKHRHGLLRRVRPGLRTMSEPFSAADLALPVSNPKIARQAKVVQMLGRIVGPFAYLRSRRACRAAPQHS